MGGMPMMSNMPNGAMPRQVGEQEGINYDARLNAWIYGYLLDKGQWELARSFKNSNLTFEPPLVKCDEDINGVNEDNKSGDNKKPDDLPSARHAQDEQGGSMLLSWFTLFWDMYAAQRRRPEASKGANHLMEQNRIHRQGRETAMYRTMNGVVPNQIDPNFQQMMRFNNGIGGDLRQKALQNQQQNGVRGAMHPHMQAIAMQQQRSAMAQHHQQMRRDPSGIDMNGQRPRTPSGGDHAPSPSKKPRMEGAFAQQQMVQNGRPPQGMQPGMIPDSTQQANTLLVQGGINPANLTETQFANFQAQNPAVQQKTIQVFASNIASRQREGAMDMAAGGGAFYPGADAAQMMRNGAMPPNGGPNGSGENHALQDYQMQLMLLEQQNKKRLLMARQEQEAPGQPGLPAGFAPGMSPQGSRGGHSPGPGGERRGTPKIGQQGLPGSPLPDGSMRGSPAAIFNPMQPELYAQMNGGMRPPPSSNPNFNAQFNSQQMEVMRSAQVRMQNGNWPQGPPGQTPMGQQPPNQQQPAQMGTPQQRNDMPPPQGPPPGASNGRSGSDDTPPTPQPTNKAPPKVKKEPKNKKQPGKGNKGSGSIAATPASEAENPPATPTPSTPITSSHPNSFAPKNEPSQATAAPNANNVAASQIAAPPPDANTAPQFNSTVDGTDADGFNMNYNDNLETSNILENFDFEQFLDHNAFSFDPAQFEGGEMLEAPIGDAA
ncbi:MAG: hypothetical protein Q9163_003450 [Psora crenata]